MRETEKKPEETAGEESEKLLEIDGLRTWFYTKAGIVKAVEDVSLEIHKGEAVGIVGESGCGKSMTAMSVMGLLKHPGKIAGGEIHFCGNFPGTDDVAESGADSRQTGAGGNYLS